MLLAEASDVAARLRRELTEQEEGLVETVLDEASVVVAAYLASRGVAPYVDLDEVPAIVRLVVSRIAARALTSDVEVPDYEGTLQAGPFSARFSEVYSSAVYLSRREKEMLASITGSAHSMPLVSERGGYELIED